MDEPIPTPPSATAARAAAVLATAIPFNGDAPSRSVHDLDPTALFCDHYNGNGGNIISLTPEFISNDNPDGTYLKRSLPSAKPTSMPTSSRKRPAASTKRTTPRRAARAGLMAVAAVVDPLTAGADAVMPPPRVARSSPASVFTVVFSPIVSVEAQSTKTTRKSRSGGTSRQ